MKNSKMTAFLLLGIFAVAAPAFAHTKGEAKHPKKHAKHHKEAAATAAPSTDATASK